MPATIRAGILRISLGICGVFLGKLYETNVNCVYLERAVVEKEMDVGVVCTELALRQVRLCRMDGGFARALTVDVNG